MQEYLRQTLVDLAAKPDVNELLNRIRALKESTRSELPAETILALREDGRR